MATASDIRAMDKAIDDLTALYEKTGDRSLLKKIDSLEDQIADAKAEIAAEQAAREQAAREQAEREEAAREEEEREEAAREEEEREEAARERAARRAARERAQQERAEAEARMFAPPVAGEPNDADERKRRVLDEIDELAEDPEVQNDPRRRRQLRSLEQEVKANAITPEQGEMELATHTRALGRTRRPRRATIGFAPPQPTFGMLPEDDDDKPDNRNKVEDRDKELERNAAAAFWPPLDPGSQRPKIDTTPRFNAGFGSLYSGAWDPAAAMQFGWGSATGQSAGLSPAYDADVRCDHDGSQKRHLRPAAGHHAATATATVPRGAWHLSA